MPSKENFCFATGPNGNLSDCREMSFVSVSYTVPSVLLHVLFPLVSLLMLRHVKSPSNSKPYLDTNVYLYMVPGG